MPRLLSDVILPLSWDGFKKCFPHHDLIRFTSVTFALCCKCQPSLWGLWWVYWTVHTHLRTRPPPPHTHTRNLTTQTNCHGICPSHATITQISRCAENLWSLDLATASLQLTIISPNKSKCHRRWNGIFSNGTTLVTCAIKCFMHHWNLVIEIWHNCQQWNK